jgi:ATP-binding cassette subfamily C (CFTR/MRP) protein 4
MSKAVIHSKILFFDSNPVGRILTRFSKDMAVLDQIAPAISILMTYGIFRAFTVTVSLCIVNAWLILPALAGLAYLIYLMKHAAFAMLEC